MANEITIELKADDRKIKEALAGTVKSSKRAGARISAALGGGFRSLGRALTSVQGQIIAVGGALVAAFASKAVLEAAARQEDAINSLNSALIASGQFSQKTSESLQAFASELQSVTRFGDELILENAALIQSLGQLDEKGLKQATAAAVDLAAALKIDLTTASQLVGRAAAGEVGTFSRYGLTIQKGATNAETFSNALSKINAQFGGAAQRDVLTFSGAAQQLSNTFGDLQEEIGFLITKSPAIAAIVGEISKVFIELGSRVKAFGENREQVDNFIIRLFDVARAVNEKVIDPFIMLSRVGKAVWKSLQTGVQFVIVEFATLAEGIAKVAKFLGMDSPLLDTIDDFADSARGMLVDLATESSNAFSDIVKPNTISQNIDQFLTRLQDSAVKASEAGKNIGDAVKNGIVPPITEGVGEVEDSLANLYKQMDQTLRQGVTNLVSMSIQKIGASLAQGTAGFSGFASGVLNIVGDMAIQLGTTLITIGLGIEKLKASLLKLTGGPAIAAGIALIALGGFLKSFVGGAVSQSVGPGAGAPSSTPGTEIQTGTPVSDQVEDRKPQPVVNITVQGNILDRKSAGLELVNVINEAIGVQNAKIIGLNA